MTVSSICSPASAAADPPRRHERPDMEKRLAPTAQLLGVSTGDLKQQLHSGTTLSDIAKSKGVSQDDLLASIREGLKAGKPEGAPELTEAQLTQMATDIAAGKRPGRPDGTGGPGGPPPLPAASSPEDNLNTLAGALGIDPTELLRQLSSGADMRALGGKEDPYSSRAAWPTRGLAVDAWA